MQSKIQLWGDSLALRIPKPIAKEVGLSQYSDVEISVADGKILILPVQESQSTLEALLSEVADENLHHEVNLGQAAGREVW
ncbi:MAG: AbrB/MazE/SpoVT family DNA-binding domain-containing protein [Acidobacteriota bacterium]